MIDQFSNLLTCIRNGINARRLSVDVARSACLEKLIFFFIQQGLLSGVRLPSVHYTSKFRIYLKYHGNKPVISGIIRVSKPSRRVRLNVTTLKRLYTPYVLFVLSTNCGYLNAFQALQKKISGELVCVIY